jgi:hypothetical protein
VPPKSQKCGRGGGCKPRKQSRKPDLENPAYPIAKYIHRIEDKLTKFERTSRPYTRKATLEG